MDFKSSPERPAAPLQTLEGVIERITFQNEENGYTVARLIPRGYGNEVTVIGTLTGVSVGESVSLRGYWIQHPTYGRQFEIRFFTVQLPATVEGMRKYLGSGLIKGIGPATARRIVDYFGMDTLTVIESAPQRLHEVSGIGDKRIEWITRAWEEQKQIKELMFFLQGHGVSTSLAVKIFRHYKDEAMHIVQTDPYRLARDVYGIGFKTADKIAQKLGIAPNAPERLQAGLRHALGTLSDEGHCFATRDQLLLAAAELLEVPAAECAVPLDTLLTMEELIADDDAIYLPPFYHAERNVANRIAQLLTTSQDRLSNFQNTDWDRAWAWLEKQNPLRLTDTQKAAVQMALTSRVSVITGGPGTGKSTIVGSLIRLLQTRQGIVRLAAPTGRAAKRLSETTGLEAQTLHRLLEFSPNNGNTFLRDRENPLDADLVVVDESSMLDLLLTNHLLKALSNGTHLLFVGDVDQLPSVGAGNVLHDLIAGEVVPVTRLETIFRQAEDSAIILNAHRINRGELPLTSKEIQDFFMFKEPDPEKAAALILDLVAERIPRRFGADPQTDIQILSPMHHGIVGVAELNRRLQERLNPPGPGKAEINHGSRLFRVGDRVLQLRNNYDKQIFNGDLGRMIAIDLEEQLATVDYEGINVDYDFSELDELTHAYALSIHKSQGSEFPIVVIPLLTQHYMMLQRNLLYTGVTRARKRVVLVGSWQAVAMAVKNHRVTERNTRLAERLKTACGKRPPELPKKPS